MQIIAKIAEIHKINNGITDVKMLVFNIPIAHRNAAYLNTFEAIFTHICSSIIAVVRPKMGIKSLTKINFDTMHPVVKTIDTDLHKHKKLN